MTIPSAIEGNLYEGDWEGDYGTLNAGGLVKQGSGKLTLTGNNTYTGQENTGTHVMAGTLHCDGSIKTDVTVDEGATLSGNLMIQR